MEQQEVKRAIAACEKAYQACFCTGEELDCGIRWRDDALPDMYDHHFLRLNEGMSDAAMEQAIRRETALRKAQGAGFCKVTLPDDWAGTLGVGQDAEIAKLGCYAMPAEKLA
ncbi:MAG: hypothetical protein PHD32_10685, partial [Eubacteriales bacterium]|nr:hypothetical protein [Eubacteriales bacterium]